jgi:hypothetical protein
MSEENDKTDPLNDVESAPGRFLTEKNEIGAEQRSMMLIILLTNNYYSIVHLSFRF